MITVVVIVVVVITLLYSTLQVLDNISLLALQSHSEVLMLLKTTFDPLYASLTTYKPAVTR